MFSDYKDYLSSGFSVNYWSDEGIDAAREMLDAFSDSDWGVLLQTWAVQSAEWRVRCAETIDSQSHPAAAKLLLAMLHDSDDDVKIAAIDALRSLDSLVLKPEDIKLISGLNEGSRPVGQLVINDLLRKFGGGGG